MKKVVLSIAIAGLILGGCSKQTQPDPVPSLESPSVAVSEGSTPTPGWITPNGSGSPTQDSEEPTKGNQEPTSNPATSDAAAPPATQFAQRWGQKYPNVPEFAILKTANATCAAIQEVGDDWETNAAFLSGVEKVMDSAGMNKSDALEFAQDVNQNYCSSVENPA